ncbi:MAG: hypothetical protein JNM14_07010 [Ferruginibacter sp.]|nr:hypothetical protein [Ferruginibacter sp.]
MKKLLQKTGIAGITLLYCLFTGLYSGVAFNANAAIAKQGSSKESYNYSIAAKTFQHTLQTENAVTVCSHHKPVTVKDTYKELSDANLATGHILLHTFSQYNFFSNKLLVRLQNTDLIFPFQYFW